MSKERTISGIKVIVSRETYDEYKGTLQEQLEEKDKEIERLHSIIKEVREYINKNTINNTFYEEFNGEVKELLAILDKENI